MIKKSPNKLLEEDIRRQFMVVMSTTVLSIEVNVEVIIG